MPKNGDFSQNSADISKIKGALVLKDIFSESTYGCVKDTLFLPKNGDFLQTNAEISKIMGALVLKDLFSETTYGCVLTYQIEISSIILTIFRQEGRGGGGGNPPPTHLKTNL